MTASHVRRFLITVTLIGLAVIVLAPVLLWDPTTVVPQGGDGYAALDEWGRLERNNSDQERRDALVGNFELVRSHLGRSWYTTADSDGTCWALALEPIDLRPHRAPDDSWCTRNGN